MSSKIYSKYDTLAEYTHSVGNTCSLLYHCGVDVNGIDIVLSTAQLFKSIEQGYNPLMATSNEMHWIHTLCVDEELADVITEDVINQLTNTDALETDWLSMWAGSIIAHLAVKYDVPMSEILSVMTFEEFMQKSVALHAQPDGYIERIFSNRMDERGISLRGNGDIEQICNEHVIYVDNRETVDNIISSIGANELISSLFGDEEIIIAAHDFNDKKALIAVLSALNMSGRDIVIKEIVGDVELECENFEEYIVSSKNEREYQSSNSDGIMLPNLFGAWGSRASWLLIDDEQSDRAKYLKSLMSYFMFVPRRVVRDYEKINVHISAEQACNLSAHESFVHSAYMAMPFRPRR